MLMGGTGRRSVLLDMILFVLKGFHGKGTLLL
jgi:hypothetical protein